MYYPHHNRDTEKGILDQFSSELIERQAVTVDQRVENLRSEGKKIFVPLFVGVFLQGIATALQA